VDEIANFADYDLCMIAGGLNDYDCDSPIGEFVNTGFDKGVFTQAYQYIIEKILTQNPTIKIFLCTPLQATFRTAPNQQGNTQEAYANRIKDIGKYYSIPVLDLYGVGGINKVNMSVLTIDKLHPNNDGYKLVCEHSLIPFVRNI
jgi:lysophospholipase L1-like esterase